MRPGPTRASGTRLLRHPVGLVADLPAAFRALVGDGDGFWLDSAAPDPGRPDARHYLGAGERIFLDGPVLPALRAELEGPAPEADDDAPDFRLGVVGWFEYELRGETTGPAFALDHAPARLLRVDRALAVDAATGEGELIALGPAWEGELADWRDGILAALRPPRPPSPGPAAGFAPIAASRAAEAAIGANPGEGTARFLDSDERYLEHIRACLAAIVDGEAYQLCLTTRVELPGLRPDPVELLARLRATSPTHHAGLVRIGDTALVSASPERFLAVDRHGRVSTSPIKGTRPRGADAAEDTALRAELLGSEKERAENLMIVDLMRNDLSRVCEPGSVEVTALLQLESYAQVHQLVSTVEGRLTAGLGAVDALAACFPAGSMTGAPKRRATELLDRLEGRPRGVYAGAFGWIGRDGAADLAMVIRSVVIGPEGASVGTGGGITSGSVPEEELAEMRLKAAPLLAALGAGNG